MWRGRPVELSRSAINDAEYVGSLPLADRFELGEPLRLAGARTIATRSLLSSTLADWRAGELVGAPFLPVMLNSG